MNPRARFDRFDLGLFALGVLGLTLFAGLLPAQHPDSAATYDLGRERAVEEARVFLEGQGFATDDLVPKARLTRVPRLLDSLQHDLGRAEAVRLLKGDAAEVLPAYHWEVGWRHPVEEGSMFSGADGTALVFEVALTQRGRPWQLRNRGDVVPDVDREGLRTLLPAAPEVDDWFTVSPDSALGALLHFDLSSASQLADSAALVQADQARLHDAATTGRPQGLGEAAAAEIARHHLGATVLADLPLAVASVEALPERGRAAARVRFETTERVHGQHVAAETDVTATGALIQLVATYSPESESDVPDEGVQLQFGSSDAGRQGASWIGYIALVLVLLVVMFRRLSARALDAQAALKDALVAAVLTMAAVGLTVPMFATDMGWGWELFAFLGLGMVFSGAGIGLLVFIVSASSDALARAASPERIATLSFVRQGAWVNEPVGRALVRGAAVAGMLVGLATVLFAVLPRGIMDMSGDQPLLGAEAALSVAAVAFAQRGWQALVLVLAAFVGLGALLRRWRPGLEGLGLGLALGVLGPGVIDLPLGPWWVGWSATLAVGFVLAALYRRYDALTILVGLVLAGVLWDTAEGWLVAGSPAWLDVVLGGALLVGAAVLGFVGVRSGRAGDALPRYVPDYLVEQRERGRLQRELEIAREVQRSFLPARMPHVEGLDLAAQCIAAEEVGGDYYDVIPLPGASPGQAGRRLALVIGDVSGKGIQAAFFMTLAKGFLQSLARETDSPAEVLRRANRLFFANAPRGTFVSLIYGVFDLDARTLTFARAGHNPVILKRSPDHTAEFVQPAGLALGLTSRAVFDETIREETVALSPGDTLVFYTDGFSEAMDPAKRLYTDERLAEAVAAHPAGSAADLLQALVDDVVGHAGAASQHDDMTMVVVRVGSEQEAVERRDAAVAVTL